MAPASEPPPQHLLCFRLRRQHGQALVTAQQIELPVLLGLQRRGLHGIGVGQAGGIQGEMRRRRCRFTLLDRNQVHTESRPTVRPEPRPHGPRPPCATPAAAPHHALSEPVNEGFVTGNRGLRALQLRCHALLSMDCACTGIGHCPHRSLMLFLPLDQFVLRRRLANGKL